MIKFCKDTLVRECFFLNFWGYLPQVLELRTFGNVPKVLSSESHYKCQKNKPMKIGLLVRVRGLEPPRQRH